MNGAWSVTSYVYIPTRLVQNISGLHALCSFDCVKDVNLIFNNIFIFLGQEDKGHVNPESTWITIVTIIQKDLK